MNRQGEPVKCIDVDSQCPCSADAMTPNGRATGECISSKCEIFGWCTANPPKDGDDVNLANLQEKYNAVIDNIEHSLVALPRNTVLRRC